MAAKYWTNALSQRLTRRRTLAGAGAAVAGAAFLAACGGGGSSGSGSKDSGPKDKSGLLVAAVDTTKDAKRGGTLRRNHTSDPATLDANGLSASLATYLEFVYARLLAFKPGYMEQSANEVVPDNAESFEISPDKLTLNLKLRPGVKFHNLPPVNGRAVDVEDVLFSWKRFSAVGGQRAAVVNAVNPEAPIMSITAPDARTISVKLKEPLVYANMFLAHRETLNIIPKEAENTSAIDLRNRMLGTGPFQLAESDYRPSVGLTFKRHADYWQKDRPFIDQIEYPIIPEYATGQAQFRGGNLHYYLLRQEDILNAKQEIPQINMYEAPTAFNTTRAFYGWQTKELLDERVRLAMSMAVDRDLLIDTLYNTPKFEAAGLPVIRRWSTALDASDVLQGWWLDPKGKDFGPNARYFEHNLAEAKKLISAAGANGLEIPSNHFTTGQFGTDFPRNVEVWENMISECGVKFKKNIIDYSGAYLSLRDTFGKFSGVSYKIGPPAPTEDAVNRLGYEYTKSGGAVGFYGFDAAGKGDGSGDPFIETTIAKARGEFETEKRRQLVYDAQRHLASKMYSMRWAGGATQFALYWPIVQNVRVYQEGTASAALTGHLTWWLDPTKAPNK